MEDNYFDNTENVIFTELGIHSAQKVDSRLCANDILIFIGIHFSETSSTFFQTLKRFSPNTFFISSSE